MEKNVTAILVAYNAQGVIASAIESLSGSPEIAEIIVVDNCSTDDTCELIKRDFPNVTIIENPKNLGLGRANNIALKRVKTPYALLLNPDARIQPGAVQTLMNMATQYSDAAIIAPALCGEDGALHHSFKRTLFSRGKSGQEFVVPEGECCADFISGAVWLWNVKAMQRVGGFDENIFLYHEDDDICMRIHKAGLSVLYAPQAKAVHLRMSSQRAQKPETDYTQQQQMTWSRLYMEYKYKGKNKALKMASRQNLIYGFKAAYFRLQGNSKQFNHYQGRLAGIFEFTESVEKKRI